MKPRRLDSETMVSRFATAGATALGSTVSVTGMGLRWASGLAWPNRRARVPGGRAGATMLAVRARASRSVARVEPVAGAVLGRDPGAAGRGAPDLGPEVAHRDPE